MYWSIDLVYQTTRQLRENTILDLENGPGVYHLEFEGMEYKEDGLYTDRALKGQFTTAISRFYEIQYSYK